MRELLDKLIDLAPTSLIPYLFFGGGLLVTAICFAAARFLNGK